MSRLTDQVDMSRSRPGRPGAAPRRVVPPDPALGRLAGSPLPLGPGMPPLTPVGLAALQRLAGNAAVRRLVVSPTVQRCGSTPPSECPCHDAGTQTGPDEVQRQASGTSPDSPLRDTDDAAAPRRAPVPVLTPSDPRMAAILEAHGGVAGGASRSAPSDPACQVAVTERPPWMPNLRRRSPVELGRGTRRQPKLKEPDGPAGGGCRGACGPDCPPTCKTVGTYTEYFRVGDCGYRVDFPNALLCGTHQGCRTHDACFDSAVANGESYLFGPRHNQCNQDALMAWGPVATKSWARGGGPYDNWWYFVDDPVIRRSWRITRSPGRRGAAPTPAAAR